MVDLNINLPESFFEEEERDGYLVSAKTKAVWAVQLDLLSELDRVCKKHNLKYILDFGTLLGAIRHKGFIPWDVDLDVSMLHEDYEKLVKIASSEFKHPYFFQNQYDAEKKNDHCVTRLRRTDTTSINLREILFRKKYNQGIFIDIFVFDNVPTNEIKTVTSLHNKCKNICNALTVICEPPSFKDYGTRMSLLSIVRYLYYRTRYGIEKSAWNKLKIISSQFGPSDFVCCLSTDIGTYIRPRNWYENIIRVPFENQMLPVPEAYDELLTQRYGDYMTPVVDDRMTVLYTDASRSYQEVINEDGFYDRICDEFNIDRKRTLMSDWDFMKLLVKRLRSKLHR